MSVRHFVILCNDKNINIEFECCLEFPYKNLDPSPYARRRKNFQIYHIFPRLARSHIPLSIQRIHNPLFLGSMSGSPLDPNEARSWLKHSVDLIDFRLSNDGTVPLARGGLQLDSIVQKNLTRYLHFIYITCLSNSTNPCKRTEFFEFEWFDLATFVLRFKVLRSSNLDFAQETV